MKKIFILIGTIFIFSFLHAQEFEIKDAIEKLNIATSKLIEEQQKLSKRLEIIEKKNYNISSNIQADYDSKKIKKKIVVSVWVANIRSNPFFSSENIVDKARVGKIYNVISENNGFYKIATDLYIHKSVIKDFKIKNLQTIKDTYLVNKRKEKNKFIHKNTFLKSIARLNGNKWFILNSGNLIYKTNVVGIEQ